METMTDKEFFSGEVQVDDSYFSYRRKGKRGRGVVGKILVFSNSKLKNKVFTKMIPNVQA